MKSYVYVLCFGLVGCAATTAPDPGTGRDCADACEGSPPESQCVWTCEHTPEADPSAEFQPDPLPW